VFIQGGCVLQIIAAGNGTTIWSDGNASFALRATDSGQSSGIGVDYFQLDVLDKYGNGACLRRSLAAAMLSFTCSDGLMRGSTLETRVISRWPWYCGGQPCRLRNKAASVSAVPDMQSADMFITKLVSVDELLSTIARLLRKGQTAKAA
jgi:hypothetical protein